MITKNQANDYLLKRYSDVEKINRFVNLIDETVDMYDFDFVEYYFARYCCLLAYYNDDDTLKKCFVDNNTYNRELTYDECLVRLISLNHDIRAVGKFLRDLIDNMNFHFVDYSDLDESYDQMIHYYE